MASTSDIKNGMCIHHNHDIFQIIEFQHVKPGKGPAFVRTRLKSLTNGKVLDHTIPAGHKLDDVRIERRPYQFLYQDEMGYVFMDVNTYEQITIEGSLIDNSGLLKDGMEVEMLVNAEKEQPLTCELPQYVEMEITYTEPGLKGDTATNTLKPAKVETGADVRVPLFINTGDFVKIDTRTNSYVERVKK
ncbi:MAG: elongation factor P [Bacteroidetes bacterium]|nr:elongation factor P [Bacteroidota bacterium]